MNWKKFKNFYKDNIDESYFILGIDIGNDYSSISFFNVFTNSPEIIDISGGYGKPSIPTVIQYIPETKEWVFGEYAVLNKGVGKDITLSSIIEKLGKKDYIDIDSKPVSIVNILGLYLKDLIGCVKNINPNGEIVGIVVSTPSYLSSEAAEEFTLAFKAAGYDKELIGLVSDRECVFSRYFFDNVLTNSEILLLDFGSRELRGAVYNIEQKDNNVVITSSNSLFDENIGTNKINSLASELFTEYYCRNILTAKGKITTHVKNQIDSFVYQHKDLLFQKGILSKPIRLYFNFAYPPFQQNVTKEEMDRTLEPFIQNFYQFIEQVLSRGTWENNGQTNIDTVICTGGGFEMLWAKNAINNVFPNVNVKFYKNSKTVISEGAAIYAAAKLGVINTKFFDIQDLNQLSQDIGIKVMGANVEKFVPLAERNSFWWQKHPSKTALLNEKTDKPAIITIYKRDKYGNILPIKDMVLEGLPKRPKGTTKIKLWVNFESFNEFVFGAKDLGFGEMFPQSDFERKINIVLNETQ